MAPERSERGEELEIKQADGWKKEDVTWSVTSLQMVIDFFRDNPVLYDRRHKDCGNKSATRKLFALLLAIPNQVFFHFLPYVYHNMKESPAVCSLVCNGLANWTWSMLLEQNAKCVVTILVDFWDLGRLRLFVCCNCKKFESRETIFKLKMKRIYVLALNLSFAFSESALYFSSVSLMALTWGNKNKKYVTYISGIFKVTISVGDGCWLSELESKQSRARLQTVPPILLFWPIRA